MGDRGNIVVKDGGVEVYLYSHWGGSGLAGILRKSLQRAPGRHDDAPYLTRIIFSDMIEGDERSTTGFGISARIGDGRIVATVDVDAQTVSCGGRVFTVKEFAGLSDEAIETVDDEV